MEDRHTSRWDAALWRCPDCRHPLGLAGADLLCTGCDSLWPVDEVAATLVRRGGQRRALGTRAMQSQWLARIYDRWWRPFAFRASGGWQLPGFEHEVELVLERLGAAQDPWLDLSCGPGRILERLCQAAPRGRVVGLDLSRGMLERARQRAPSAVLARANAEQLPLANGTFGAVVNLAALDLYADARRVVAEAARVLAPGGRWVASTFVSPALLARWRAAHTVVASVTGIHAMTSCCLQSWVANAGLVDYDERRWGNYVLAWANKPAMGAA